MNKKLSLVLLLVCFQFFSVVGQRSLRFTSTNHTLKEAVNFVEMHYYQQAYLLLNTYLHDFRQENREKQAFEYQTALFYYYTCALKLNKVDAEQALSHFVQETPFAVLQQSGSFELGKYAFEHNQFEAAIRYYEAVGINVLTNQELIQRNFELGYSYLVTQQLDKVEPYFQSAKNIPGDYFKPGNYYHGLLAYYKKNYKEASESFNAVKDDERYKKIIPFYLTEIDYVTGEKEKALAAALHYLTTGDLYYDNELNQMVAQIYCEKEDYANAALYYTTYISKAKSVRDEDEFKLGYCWYAQDKTALAIEHLEKVSTKDKDLSKHSAYLLGICYLKNGERERATKSLERFRAMTDDESQKELVDFTLTKLSYEQDDSQVAMAKITTFLTAYLQSEHIDDVKEMLIYLHIKEQDYQEALVVLNSMNTLSFNLQKIYQKASYARGIALLKEAKSGAAMLNFQETKKYPADRNLVSMSDFWLSECNYQLGKYEDALSNCDFFLNLGDTLSMPAYTKKIHLNRMYSYLRTMDSLKFIQEYAVATGDTNTTDLLTRIDSLKPTYVPDAIPVIELEPYIALYNLPEEKISFAYKPIPLKPLAVSNEIKREDQTNFIEAAIGNVTSLNIAAGYNVDQLLKMPLYVDFKRSASTGKLANQQVNSTHLGLYTSTVAYDHDITVALEVDRERLSYYGYDHQVFSYESSAVKQSFQRVGITANVTPLQQNKAGIVYKADAYVGLYTDRNSAGEYSVKLDAPVSKQVKPGLCVHSDVLIDANMYLTRNMNIQNNSLISWMPSVTKDIDKFRLKVGLYPTLGQEFYLLPDVSIQYPLSKKYANIELAWQQHIRLNTFRQLTQINPFIFTYNKVRQSANTEIFAGLKGNALSNISYSVRSGIAIMNGLPLFVNDTSFDNKQFRVIYESQATALLLDAALDYTINSNIQAGANISLRPILQLKTNQEAWHYVPSVITMYGKMNVMKNIVVKSELIMMAGSKAALKSTINGPSDTHTIGAGVDLNVSARYTFLKNWNALLDVNNLLGSNYQRWYGYPMFGTQVMAGISYSFRQLKIK